MYGSGCSQYTKLETVLIDADWSYFLALLEPVRVVPNSYKQNHTSDLFLRTQYHIMK